MQKQSGQDWKKFYAKILLKKSDEHKFGSLVRLLIGPPFLKTEDILKGVKNIRKVSCQLKNIRKVSSQLKNIRKVSSQLKNITKCPSSQLKNLRKMSSQLKNMY